MAMLEDLLIHILALDSSFDEFEFIHAFLGSKDYQKKAGKIKFNEAYQYLTDLQHSFDLHFTELADDFPHYRKTFIKDLIQSVLMQVDLFIHKSGESVRFQDAMEKIYGLKLAPPFHLDEERTNVLNELKLLGYGSIADCKAKVKKIFLS